jgi:serine/threonine protein kinase
MPSIIWEDVIRLYKIGDKLGQGAYGEVIAGTCRFTRDSVAIKHVALKHESEYEITKLIREIMVNQGLLTCIVGQKSQLFPKIVDVIIPSEQEPDDMRDIFLVFE